MSIPPHNTSQPGTRRKLYFVGVTTGKSTIMNVFPRWAQILGLDAKIVGYDLPIGAPAQAYRDCVRTLAEDDEVSGALVTTHKAAIFDHARDLFVELDENALLCREISCIVRHTQGAAGLAKDPVTAGLALDHLLGPDYWTGSDAAAVCIGAGGAGIAIMVSLLKLESPPAGGLVIVDRDPQRLKLAVAVHRELGSDVKLRTVVHRDRGENDRLVSSSPPGSVIINATGMGKDLPGSPVSDRVRFPRRSVAWDLNYRGELGFLRIAQAQADERRVRAEDGWRYFLHGWTEVISEVFGLELTPERFARLAGAAGSSGRFVTAPPASELGAIS